MSKERVAAFYGVFTVNGIDRDVYLTHRDDDTPVVFATEAEAITWAEDYYPSFFDGPNGWRSFGFEVERLTPDEVRELADACGRCVFRRGWRW